MKKREAMLTLKDIRTKVKSVADEHMTMGLTIVALAGVAGLAWAMWNEVPEAQEAIKKKKEIDPNATPLELAAAAFPHMKKSIVIGAATGGVIIFHQHVSDARIAAATAFGAAAFGDKKAAEEKLREFLGKEKVDEMKAEAHGMKAAKEEDIVEGYVPDGDIKKQQEMALNKLYRCKIDLDNSEIFASPRQLEEAAAYIRKHYGKSAFTNWKEKPFELNVVGGLLGRDFGDIGRVLGYPSGENFEITYAPGYDKTTGEMIFLVTMTMPKEDWELPFA